MSLQGITWSAYGRQLWPQRVAEFYSVLANVIQGLDNRGESSGAVTL